MKHIISGGCGVTGANTNVHTLTSGKEITLPCIERPQPPDHECSNEMRAGWAAASLVVFSNEHGIQDEDMATQVSDFLADLHHLADTLKIDWDNVLVRADGHYQEEVSAKQFGKLEAGEYPKSMRIKGLPLDHWVVTKKDILEAPPFTVFRGPAEVLKKLEHDQWDLFSGKLPHDKVVKKMSELGIRLIRDTDGEPLHLEKDDEFCDKGVDDLDAALAYLNNGGLVVKLPDTLDSTYFRLYAVACYKPVKK
jgi:hypothetical protein